jgi:hypothetical protein
MYGIEKFPKNQKNKVCRNEKIAKSFSVVLKQIEVGIPKRLLGERNIKILYHKFVKTTKLQYLSPIGRLQKVVGTPEVKKERLRDKMAPWRPAEKC